MALILSYRSEVCKASWRTSCGPKSIETWRAELLDLLHRTLFYSGLQLPWCEFSEEGVFKNKQYVKFSSASEIKGRKQILPQSCDCMKRYTLLVLYIEFGLHSSQNKHKTPTNAFMLPVFPHCSSSRFSSDLCAYLHFFPS